MGWLESLFGSDTSEEERGRYAETVRRGNCVVAVETDDSNRDRIVEILERNNARGIDEQAENYRPGSEEGGIVDERQGTRSIPVVKEELQVGKRAVRRGGVRIYTRSVEEPVEEQVTLHEEKVNVERRPVNRPATDADATAFKDQTIEVTETSEEPVISKRARVVEEVVVGKETKERTQTVRDKVRNQKVEVEQLDAELGSSTAQDYTTQDYTTDFRRHFETQYPGSDATYETYAPAYDYGNRMASDPQYRGRRFEEVESNLKTDYSRKYPGSTWDKMRNSIRYGWERVTGKR